MKKIATPKIHRGSNNNDIAIANEQQTSLRDRTNHQNEKKNSKKFVKQHKDKVSFMHIDCDTHESTKEVLDIVGPERLVPNTRILFDDYHSYIGWKNGGFKAWQKFVKKHKIKYKYEMFGECQAPDN